MPHTQNQRSTFQKKAITTVLAQSHGFISAQQLHLRLEAAGTYVGLATVYRRLNSLVESGEVDTISISGSQLYRICRSGPHHHHLVCENCANAVEISPPSEEWITQVAKSYGYTINRHIFEAFGKCPNCSSDSSSSQPQ